MRRKHEFNLDELRKLCNIQCTDEEIAGWFACSKKTVQRLKKRPEIAAIFERGREEGKASLRRQMFALAMKGHAVMCIFLSKNYLGMKDVVETEHSMSDDKPFHFTMKLSDVPQAADSLPAAPALPETTGSDILLPTIRPH